MGDVSPPDSPSEVWWPSSNDGYAGVCNGIFYQLKTGCQWHLLPHDFPPFNTVYASYRKW